MIANDNNIREVRPLAENILSEKRINPYIAEVETLQVMQALGAGLYSQLDAFSNTICAETYNFDICGKIVTITSDQLKTILYGGYYSDCGGKSYTRGLTIAIGYLAYSRFVKQQNISVTAFGVMQKRTEFSEHIDGAQIALASNSAKNLGEEYLNQSVKHLKALKLLPCDGGNRVFKPRIKAIGR